MRSFFFLFSNTYTVNNGTLKSTGKNFAFSYTSTAQKLYRQVHLVLADEVALMTACENLSFSYTGTAHNYACNY